ncbi:MAG: methyltransferase domain-containing protein [Candidatus Omnitrophica bacterium]|nr:methyltransferase domain-containing protein [Candidatus Omnitrophota bacterium]
MILKILKRFLKPATWHNLRNIYPISNVFGLNRGTPIDRYYIEKFLSKNSSYIHGHVLEIADNTYSKRFGKNIQKQDILHIDPNHPGVTIVGDLTSISLSLKNSVDCFICTQTLNFIYEYFSAVQGIKQVLKPGGTALVTVAGLCQISQYDRQRWGDFWRFTDLSIKRIFKDIFGEANIEVSTYGNVLSATALLQGLSVEDLTKNELDFHDSTYQIVITVKAVKL